MTIVGQVESLWRYPVKSMRGESLPEISQVSPASMVTDSLHSGVLPHPLVSPI